MFARSFVFYFPESRRGSRSDSIVVVVAVEVTDVVFVAQAAYAAEKETTTFDNAADNAADPTSRSGNSNSGVVGCFLNNEYYNDCTTQNEDTVTTISEVTNPTFFRLPQPQSHSHKNNNINSTTTKVNSLKTIQPALYFRHNPFDLAMVINGLVASMLPALRRRFRFRDFV